MTVLAFAEDLGRRYRAVRDKAGVQYQLKQDLVTRQKQVSQPPVFVLATVCLSVCLFALCTLLHHILTPASNSMFRSRNHDASAESVLLCCSQFAPPSTPPWPEAPPHPAAVMQQLSLAICMYTAGCKGDAG